MIQIGARPAPIESPVEHLTACHRRIEQRLDTLVDAARHMPDNRAAALRAIENSLQFLDTSGVLHTRDEEDSLFPRLRPQLSPSELAFVDSLEAQHAEAEAVYQELKRAASLLSADAPPETLGRYQESAERLRSIYRDHIRAEDEVLAGLLKTRLSPQEISAIAAEMRARRAK